jgi:MFS family permease
VRYLPPIAGGPLLSGLADLFPGRQVMIACDVLGIGTVGLMAIPGMPFPALCALLFRTALAGAPFSSARAALLPDVPGDIFVLGSAVGDISFQAIQILGFVAGAAVVAVVDPYQTLGLDAVSFGISALIVAAGSRPRPLLVLRPADRKRGGPAAVVRPAAVEPGRRGRRVPARRRRGLRAGPAARDQGRGVRPGAIRPVRRPGARHPGRRGGGTGDRRTARRRPDRPTAPTMLAHLPPAQQTGAAGS